MKRTMNPKASSTEKFDLYQTITDQIVAAIESGLAAGTWACPWHKTAGAVGVAPINVVSRKAYRGVNTVCLWAATQQKGYTSSEWGTYAQWQEKGAQVRKGEKSTLVVFWKFRTTGAESQDGEESDTPTTSGESKLCFTRGYHVFNAAQVDGYQAEVTIEPTPEERDANAEAFFAATGADIRHGGNRAYYSPAFDFIQMPTFAQFITPTHYYSTLAHECGHWTGAKGRCNRQFGNRFGDKAYAAEELVAELTAAYICGSLGFASHPREDHAMYIQHWLGVLKADKRAIFTAASKAQQAADFLVKASADAPAACVAA